MYCLCRCCPKSASGLCRRTRRRRQSLGERGTLALLPCRPTGWGLTGKFLQAVCACCQAHMLAGRRGRPGFLKQKAKKEGGEVCRREKGKKAYSAENGALPKHPCSHFDFCSTFCLCFHGDFWNPLHSTVDWDRCACRALSGSGKATLALEFKNNSTFSTFSNNGGLEASYPSLNEEKNGQNL